MKVCQQIIVRDLRPIAELFKLDYFLPVAGKGENFEPRLVQRQHLLMCWFSTSSYCRNAEVGFSKQPRV